MAQVQVLSFTVEPPCAGGKRYRVEMPMTEPFLLAFGDGDQETVQKLEIGANRIINAIEREEFDDLPEGVVVCEIQ